MEKFIKLLLICLFPLALQAQIFDTGTLQRNRSDSTVRGNFGSRGVMMIPTVSTNGTNGYILVFDGATNKYVPTAYTPTPTGLADSLLKKANRTFDNVASNAIAQAKVLNLTSDLALKAPLASPVFTGTPLAPTATAGTNTTQIATTAFVTNGIATAGGSYVTLTGNQTISGYKTFTGAGSVNGITLSGGSNTTQLLIDRASTSTNGAITYSTSGLVDWVLTVPSTTSDFRINNNTTTALGISDATNVVSLPFGLQSLKILDIPTGTPGTDSLLVHDNSTNSVNRIAASYYATASSLSGFLPVNNPTFTGTLTGPLFRGNFGAQFSAINTGFAGAFGFSTDNYGVRLGADNDGGIIQVAQGTTPYVLKLQPYGGTIQAYGALTGTSATFPTLITSGSGSGESLASGSIDVGKDIGIDQTQGVVSGGARVLSFQEGTYEVQTNGDHNITGNISAANLASGTYTPTLTNGTNVASSTAGEGAYTRVGNQVSGWVDFSMLGSSDGTGTINVSLPVASNFTSATQATADNTVPRASETLGDVNSFQSDSTNDNFVITATVLTSGSRKFRVQFQYTIL